MANTELTNIKVALAEGEETLSSLVAKRVEPTKVQVKDVEPKFPEALKITDDVKKALTRLPEVFGKTVVTSPRMLEQAEVADLYDEYDVLTNIADLMVERKENIKEYVRNHADADVKLYGDPNTEKEANGHFIVSAKGDPFRLPIEGQNKDFSIEYRSGRSGKVEISSERLLDLYENGDITRQEYLSLTRETRVFDESKATKAVIENPALMDVIRKATVTKGATAPGQSLYIRKAK